MTFSQEFFSDSGGRSDRGSCTADLNSRLGWLGCSRAVNLYAIHLELERALDDERLPSLSVNEDCWNRARAAQEYALRTARPPPGSSCDGFRARS